MRISTLLILAFLLFSGNSFGQGKWTKKIDKVDKASEKGENDKASFQITKLLEKLESKAGKENIYAPYLLLKRAKYDLGLGQLVDFERDFYEALASSERNHTAESGHRPLIKIEAAEIASSIGRYEEARLLLESAKTELDSSIVEIPHLEARLAVDMGDVLGGQGYFIESLAYLNSCQPYFASHLSRKKIIIDSLGNSKSNKIPKRKAKERYKEYANYLTVYLSVYGSQGKQLSADSIYARTIPWVDKLLGSKSFESARLRHRMAVILTEHGTPLNRELDPANIVKDFRSKHRLYHPLGFEINELYLKGFIAEGNLAKYFSRRDYYKQLLYGQITQNSFYWARLAILEFDPRFNNIANSNKFGGNVKLDIAQQSSQVLANLKSLPKNGISIPLIDFLQSESVRQKDYAAAEDYAIERVALKTSLTGAASPEANLAKLKLANHLVDFTNDLRRAKEIYDSSYYGIVSRQIGPWHKDHLEILNHMASMNELLDNYDQASLELKKAVEVAYSKFGNLDFKYAQELSLVSKLQIKIGDYEGAQKNISASLELLDRFRREEDKKIYLINAIEVQAMLQGLKGEFAEAEASLARSRKIIKRADDWVGIGNISTATELSNLYLLLGRYSQAGKILPNLVLEYKALYGPKSLHVMEPLINLGKLNLAKGEYSEAEKIGLEAHEIAMSVYGPSSMKTALASTFLADVYYTLGDYEAAEKKVDVSLTNQRKQFGNNHIDVAKSLAQLALIKFHNDGPKNEVEKLLIESRDIIENKLGSDNPQYAETLKMIAILYMSEKRYDIAFSSLTRAEAIWRTRDTTRVNVNLAEIYTLTSDVFYIRRQFDKAEEFLKKSQRIYERNFGRNNPEYVKVMAKLSRVYYMKGEYKKSKRTIEDVLATYTEFINKYFPSLSENQKAKYWGTIKDDFNFYYSLAFGPLDDFRNLTSHVYDYQLMTKAMLLNSSIKVRERILSSTDDDLKALFKSWVEKKETLTSSLSMSTVQLKENEIDVNALMHEVEQIEKQLSEKSEIFGSSFDDYRVTHKDVQNSLGKNEVAIEILRYRHFDHVFTDSIIYIGLYVKNDKNAPGTIRFSDGKELENRYYKYYRNCMIAKIHDNFSYAKFWQPIVETVGQAASIYFSPDGVFNQINIESIPTPNGKYVIDDSNIILVGNTKELYYRKAKTRFASTSKTAYMFGNPAFYLASADGKIPSLPGTEKEVDDLKKLLVDRGWMTDEYVSQTASEENVKEMRSPRIFHIATHGFYNESDSKTEELGDFVAKESTNPLLKTGLLLTGAGDLLDETNYNFNLKNGILTAYEAMNLNLDQTDLVVLSACETGLGEISNGEGVYGLQRAFLVAGAKVLIMSLFKVDDQATQKLILNFYAKWLQTGELRKSFIESKKELRVEYGEPINWGSFIIMGLE